MWLSFCGSPKSSKETEALHYSDTNFWEQTPQCLGDKLETFLYFSNNKVCDSVPHFVWIHLRVSRLLGLLFLKSTVFSPSQRFSTNNLLLGMLQVFYFSFTNMWSSPTCYFSQEVWCTNSGEIDLHVHGKEIQSFYASELMIQFLVDEGFLNMHSDILLNLTPTV